MEDRVQQFHTDAQRPRDPKTPKEIERLRKFLFKNQEYRFTEREQSHLFSAVQAHYAAHADLPAASAREPALELIEDCLKMPFTVFTTSQKKTYLKWHAKLTGSEGDGRCKSSTGAKGSSDSRETQYQVIDVTDETISCMTEDGDVVDLDVTASNAELVAKLREGFEGGKAVSATLEQGGKALREVHLAD